MGQYDVAQVCQNGHAITGRARGYPENRAEFCPKCGEPTIMQCVECNAEIPGVYDAPGVLVLGSTYYPPAYCRKCGKPYPWTARQIRAAKEMADELDELSVEDREKLKRSIDHLSTDGPETELAAVRFKKIIQKLGKGSVDGMKHVVRGLATEAAKRLIFNG